MKSLSFNWILSKVWCVDTSYLGIAYFRGERSFFSHSYVLLLLFPSGSFWKRNIWKLITIWKSISRDANTDSVGCVCHTIRHPLWLEQPQIMLWNHLIHAVCGPHPMNWMRKEVFISSFPGFLLAHGDFLKFERRKEAMRTW